jgi:hypothetical protein
VVRGGHVETRCVVCACIEPHDAFDATSFPRHPETTSEEGPELSAQGEMSLLRYQTYVPCPLYRGDATQRVVLDAPEITRAVVDDVRLPRRRRHFARAARALRRLRTKVAFV